MPADRAVQRPKLRLWAVCFWLALWQLASMAVDDRIVLVSPVTVALRLWELLPTAGFWRAVGSSLSRITLGFVLGVGTGTVLAAVCARFRRVQELLDPVLLAVRAVPVASFIILALILFSSRNLAVLISFLMVVPVVYANVLEGIRSADRQMLEMARVFRIPLGRRLRYLYAAQVFPHFSSACMAGLGMSWKSGVAAEVIGIPSGSIGEQLQQAKVYFDTPDLFAWTLVIVAASLLCERVLARALAAGKAWTERMKP